MHNVLAFRYFVRVLKCVPLHPLQNRSRYAYWKVRFCTDSSVPLKAASGVSAEIWNFFISFILINI